MTKGTSNDGESECSSFYATGFVEGWLTHFTRTTGQPTVVFTHRVAELLLLTGQPRAADRVPGVQLPPITGAERLPEVESPGGARGKASGQSAVRRGPYKKKGVSKRRMSAAARKRLSEGMKDRWKQWRKEGSTGRLKPSKKAGQPSGVWTAARRRKQAERMRKVNRAARRAA